MNNTKKNIRVFIDFDGTITEKDVCNEIFKKFGKFDKHINRLFDGEIDMVEFWNLEIEDLKKGLARLTQVPGISLVAIPAITIKPATDVEISLGMVGHKITRTTQVIWIVLDYIMRQHISTAHGKCTSGCRVHTRDPGTA